MGTTRKTILLFWRANMRRKPLFFGTIAAWLSGMILQKLVMPLIAAHAINLLVKSVAAHNNDWSVFIPYIVGVGITGVVSQVLINSSLVLLSKLETRVRPELENELYDFLIRQSLGFHADKFSGALVAQVNRFTASYITVTDQFVLWVMRLITNVFIAIAIICVLIPWIGFAMSIWTAIFITLNVILTRRRMKYSRAAAQADSVLTAHLADTISNMSAVKAFAGEIAEKKQHSRLAYDRAKKKYRAWLAAIRNDLVFSSLMTLLYFMVLVLSIHFALNNLISIGLLVLVQVYLTQLITELWGLSGLMRTIEQALTDAEEMTEVLDESTSVTDAKHPENVRISKGEIVFRDVSFTHNKDDSLFENFSLHIKPGERIGVVGHSGSGKTTLTRLLLRFSDIESGEIAIDGQNISNIRQSDLRAHISYVPQEPALFHRTLYENIAYGKPDATQEEVSAAAKSAYADDFIENLPNGYDTMVGERGVKLSGGQRQRIAIARAILKDAPILVLDEATSALDSESEKLIQKSLKQLMKKRTAIVIAHRLSTIQQMDRIVVLEGGAIVEQGTHAELLQKNGVYAELWKHQSGGFIEE